jgi:hypothetical protein
MGKAASLSEVVIGKLASDSAKFRQHAIYLLEDIINSSYSTGEYDLFDVIIRHMQSLFDRGRETFEFSQVVSLLLKTMLSLKRYEPVAAFLDILGRGRKIESNTTTYESATIKRIFNDLDDSQLIDRLILDLEQPDNNQTKWISQILTAIQSDQVALLLAGIVTHPDRSVRQRSLNILSDLGWPSLRVFSFFVHDDSNFVRAENRHELPDEQWFLVRNAIFVLGNLGRPEACNALRLRLCDPDVRIRRELVRALEKINDDEAVDLLMILAEDIDPIIREAAIIALGVLRRKDLAPFFIDLLTRNKKEAVRIIMAIAYTGSKEGQKFLKELLQDNDRLKAIASGKTAVNDLKRSISKGLEIIIEQKTSDSKDEKNSLSPKSGLGKMAKMFMGKLQPKK